MPRMKGEVAHLVGEFTARLEAIVAAARAEGRDEALGHIRNLVSGDAPVRRGPGRPRKDAAPAAKPTKSGKGRKNPWAGLSPAERLARVNAIRKGKGLPPRDA